MSNTPSRSPVRRRWRGRSPTVPLRTGGWRAAALALAILAGVLGLQIVAAGPAAAHTRLVSSSPSKGAKLDRLPQVVSLTFSQVVRLPAAVVVTGPGGAEVSTDKAAIADATLSRPVTGDTGAAAGRYTISYRVTSADGHPISGTIAFTLSTGPAPPAAVGDAVPAKPDPRLASSSPATGAELARLPEVAVLNFKELVRQPAALVVTGPDGGEISTGQASVVDATLLRPLDSSAEQPAGSYTLRYRVTSAAGLPISGTVTFTLPDGQPAAEAELLVGDELDTQAAAAPATDPPGGVGAIVALVVGLAVALGVAVVSVGWLVSRASAA